MGKYHQTFLNHEHQTENMPKIKKTRAARLLDQMNIPYELISCEVDPADLSAQAVAKGLGLPPELVYKTLVARGEQGPIEACLPADYELDLKALARASKQKKIALVPVKELPLLTGYQRGGCSPLGGKKDFPVYIHHEIMNQERVALNAGQRGLMFFLAPEDLIKATKGILAPIAQPEISGKALE